MSRMKVLPEDVKQSCICLVKGYSRRKQEYKLKREELMNNSPNNVYTIRDRERPDDESRLIGVMMPGAHNASRTTENIAQRLQGLEDQPDTKRMRAVEYALKHIGLDLPDDQRKLLTEAIYISCINGRKCPFERLNIVGMERTSFYNRRARFLFDIAKFMGMV